MRNFFLIKCLSCGKNYTFKGKLPKCCSLPIYYDNFEPLIDDSAPLRTKFKKEWIDLGVGGTPLIPLNNLWRYFGAAALYGKAEYLNPFGSFKDRESEVAINIAKLQGVSRIAVISSGNAAISAAACSQKAGVLCVCFVPEKISNGKLALLSLFRPEIKKIAGYYENVYRTVVDSVPNVYHVSAGQNPFRELGSQEIAFEIFGKIGIPDKIIIPAGNGLLLWAIYRGFRIIQKNKKVKLPQLIGVQIKGAAPIAAALAERKPYVSLERIEDSIAEGIVAKESYCSPKVLLALRETQGKVVEVTDKEIKEWQQKILRKESLLLEPTAVVVFPALEKISIKKKERIVLILTGNRKEPIA